MNPCPEYDWRRSSDRQFSVIFGLGANGDAHDRRAVEAFLADVLAVEGENPDAIRHGVHVALADSEQILKLRK
jgi:hypothetical protein